MSLHDKKPLVVTEAVIQEVVSEIERVFMLETDKINIVFDQHMIQINVLPPYEQPFVLPQGPQFLRYEGGNWNLA